MAGKVCTCTWPKTLHPNTKRLGLAVSSSARHLNIVMWGCLNALVGVYHVQPICPFESGMKLAKAIPYIYKMFLSINPCTTVSIFAKARMNRFKKKCEAAGNFAGGRIQPLPRPFD
jgi:hypothetical protein